MSDNNNRLTYNESAGGPHPTLPWVCQNQDMAPQKAAYLLGRNSVRSGDSRGADKSVSKTTELVKGPAQLSEPKTERLPEQVGAFIVVINSGP